MDCQFSHTHDQPEASGPEALTGGHKRLVSYLLLLITGLAIGLRVWGIHFGLPYDLTYDEIHEIVRAFKLGAGEYDWDRFAKGGLYYFLFVEYGLLYLTWSMIGWVTDTRDFAIRYFQDASVFYLAGRLTVALMGTLTCWVVFCIGRKLYDVWVGLGAALIGATAYYHGMWSHYINVDIGMTLALWTSILAYLQYEETHKLRWLWTAGALGGIAIAFKLPGAIVVPVLLTSIVLPVERWRYPLQILKESVLVFVALMVTLTVIAPEWMNNSVNFSHFFDWLGDNSTPSVSTKDNFDEAVDVITIYGRKQWLGYLYILFTPYNLALTLSALLGAGLALWRRHRWDLIWAGLSIVVLVIMSAAERHGSERYILLIMPGLWLLSMRAIIALSQYRLWMAAIGIACVIAYPLMTLAYHDYMWTKPDTRVLAKRWIESNIPSGATILMDGQRYRFVQSPPLVPDASAVARRVAQAKGAKRLSRGVSHRTLELYSEAMSRIKGPRYDLHSTVWGLAVEDLSHYVESCFDYIIISSMNALRYTQRDAQQRFPKSVQFYEQLPTDDRFQNVYSAEPMAWKSSGPTITVYKVNHSCQ